MTQTPGLPHSEEPFTKKSIFVFNSVMTCSKGSIILLSERQAEAVSRFLSFGNAVRTGVLAAISELP